MVSDTETKVYVFLLCISSMLRILPLRACRPISLVRYLEIPSDKFNNSSLTVIVKPIPSDLTWRKVKMLMKEFGFIRSCVMDKVNGVCVAIVTFGHGTDMQTTMAKINESPVLQRLGLQVDQYRLPEIGEKDVKDIGTCRVLVKGLPLNCRWQDVKDHMKSVGQVVSVHMNTDAEMQFVGSASVVYKTTTEASKAYAVLNKSVFRGKLLYLRADMMDVVQDNRAVEEPKSNPFLEKSEEQEGEGSQLGGEMTGKTLFVHNLHYEVGWMELKDHFRTAGNVEKADVLVDRNGVSKGVGFVVFHTEKDAAKALETLHMSRIKNRPIFCRYMIPIEKAAEARISNKVFIDGLPHDVKWSELANMIRVSTEGFKDLELKRVDRLQKQTAVVAFETATQAKNAISILNNSYMMERVIKAQPFRNWMQNVRLEVEE